MRFTQIIAFVALLVCLVPTVTAQTAARRQFDQAVAIEDPTERIAALKEFLKENSEEELSLSAQEQVVLSWAQLAERQLVENNITAALEAFRRALSELPAQTSDRFYKDTVARIPFVISARGYRPEAIEFARLLETRFAKEPLRLGALGELYMNLEAPSEAIRALETATKLAPDEIRLRRPLAAAYRMSLRLSDAVKEFEQVAALDQRDGRAYGELGNLARARGDYEEANRLYLSQLRVDETQLSAIKGLALSALAEGRDDEAQKQLERIVQAKNQVEIDTDLHLQTQMAFYYLARGKTEKAAEAAVRALTIEPRYSWTRIAAAEVDMADGRPFEAEKHLLAALRNSDFATLRFTLGKLYLAVEDFDGALEQFARVLTLTSDGKFKARLGGVLDIEAEGIKEVLARERQAAIFVAVPPTSDEQFTMAESLVRLDARIRNLKSAPATQARRGRTVRESQATIEALANAFIDAEGGRRAFRALYVARRLAGASQSLPFVLTLTDQVLDLAEAATEPEGSLLEFPNYDREARLRIVRGRALDTRGWALFQLKRNREAMTALAEAIDAYGGIAEAKLSVWRLAMVRETVGEEREALGLYLAAYEPPTDPGAVDVKRTLIEVLYRKVNGSLEGLDEKLGVAPRATVATSTPVAEPNLGESSTAAADLPQTASDRPSLASGRSVAMGKGAYAASTIVMRAPALRPSLIGKPVTLVESSQRETPSLASRRMNPRLLRLPVVDSPEAPRVSPVVVQTLIETGHREVDLVVVRRMSARLMRWPALASSEAALSPSDVGLEAPPVAAEGEKLTESSRPRVVTSSTRPRTTSEPQTTGTSESSGSTRSRRVTKSPQN